MCGIAGYYLKDPQNTDLPPNKEREDFVNGLLRGIEYRGRDATGVVALQRASTQPHLEKADIEASEFIKWRKPLPWNSRIVLLHTRAATQGSPTNLDNNHPVVHKTCYVTHNGHIRNDDELFKDNDITRIAQVDSEIIPALIDRHGLDKVHLALQELEGGFAIAAVQPERYPDVLVLAKGRNSPLEFVETEQAIVWASTTGAIRDAWRGVWGEAPEVRVIQSLKEGELLYIEDGKVEKLEFKVKQYTPVKTYSTPNTTVTYATSYGHENYLVRFCDTKVHRATCMCKHSKWSHTGLSNGGWCIKSDCSCRQFIQGSFLTKREWRKQEVYKEVQAKRDELNKLRAENKKRKAEVSRRALTRQPGTPRTMQGIPPVKGQLRMVYEKGTRKIYDDKKLVAVQFKCDGCDEYAPVLGSAQQGTYRFCIDCWGEECDMCGSFFDPEDVTEVDVGGDTVTPNKWYLCKGCYNTLNTATDETFEAAVTKAEEFEAPSGPSRGIIEGLVVDNMCIKLTAEDVGCKAAFLYELLFDMEPSEIKAEGWLENAYVIAKSAYRKNMADLRQGLPNATSKALAIRGSEDFSPRSVKEAVEVGGESPNGEECGVRVFADE